MGMTASELALFRSIATERLNSLANSLARVEDIEFVKSSAKCLTEKEPWTYNDIDGGNITWILSKKKFYPDVSGSLQTGFIERVCIYSSTKYAESETAPGLYVVQAEPKAAGPLLQPLRVLFCRPQSFCLK